MTYKEKIAQAEADQAVRRCSFERRRKENWELRQAEKAARIARSLVVITVTFFLIIIMLAFNEYHKALGATDVYCPEQLEQTAEPSPAVKMTDKERNLIIRVMAAESRGECLEGQMAVAQVIHNRSRLWGKTLTEVLTARGQFAKPYQGRIPDRTLVAFAKVFEQGETVISDKATHFAQGNPYWAKAKTFECRIGCHNFWR